MANNSQPTSVRNNSLPQGGATATANTSQGRPLLPTTTQIKQISDQFMEGSELNCVQLNTVNMTPQQQTQFQVSNVGLGQDLEMYVSGTVNFQNTSASAQAINLAPDFPFNLLSNIQTQFNGQTVINNLSGYELLGIMAKRYKGLLINTQASGGNTDTQQNNVRVDQAIAWIKAGANVTLTQGNGVTGVSSLSVAGNSTGVVTFGMYLRLPYTMRDDILLGLIPMQNNSVYANISLTVPALLATTPKSPFYVPTTVPATLTVASSTLQCQPCYNFWAIPVPNNAQLYSYLCSHSYMLLSVPSVAQTKTGAEALSYPMPNNYYLLALLMTLRDSGDNLINTVTNLENPYLNYNGTARVDRKPQHIRQARSVCYYEGAANLLGQLLWNGAGEIDYQTNSMNTSRWLDMYQANNPTFTADVAEAYATPGSFSMLREQLVPANVQIV